MYLGTKGQLLLPTFGPMSSPPPPSSSQPARRPSLQTLAWYRFRRWMMIGIGAFVVVLVLAAWGINRLATKPPGGLHPPAPAPEAVAERSAAERDPSRPTPRRPTTPSPDWLPAGSYESIRGQLESVVFGGQGKPEDALALVYISQELGMLGTARRALEVLAKPGAGSLDAEGAAYREVFIGRQAVLEKRPDEAIAVARRVARGIVRNRPEGRWLVAKAAELALERKEYDIALELAARAGPEDSPSLHLSAVRALAALDRREDAVAHLRRHAGVFPPVERALAQAELMIGGTDPYAFRDAWDEAYDRVLEEHRQEHVARLLTQAWRAGERERLDLAVQTWEEGLPHLAIDDLTLTGMLLELIRHGATESALVLADVIAGRDHEDWSRQHNLVYLQVLVKGDQAPLLGSAEDLWRQRPSDPMGAATALLAATRAGNGTLAEAVWSQYPPSEWARTAPGTRVVAAWCRLRAGHPEEARPLVSGIMPEGLIREEAAMLEEVRSAF